MIYTRLRSMRSGRTAWAGLVVCTLLCTASAAGTDEVLTPYETEQVIKRETAMCQQCHSRSVNVWRETAHKTTYDTLHLRKKARSILENLGESGSVRRNALCVQCHYTQTVEDTDAHLRTIAGVSCQRCHGGAADWVQVHHDAATIPNRAERLAEAARLGMRPTTDLYTLAAQCFECHTVPKEELVNTGHHAIGSDFDLLGGVSGALRHNFLDDHAKQRRAQDTNRDLNAETRQLYFVLGSALEMEFALRGLAGATVEGLYLTAMTARAQQAYDNLTALGGMEAILAPIPTNGDSVLITPGNPTIYLAAADRIRAVAQTIESNREDFSTALAAAARLLAD